MGHKPWSNLSRSSVTLGRPLTFSECRVRLMETTRVWSPVEDTAVQSCRDSALSGKPAKGAKLVTAVPCSCSILRFPQCRARNSSEASVMFLMLFRIKLCRWERVLRASAATAASVKYSQPDRSTCDSNRHPRASASMPASVKPCMFTRNSPPLCSTAASRARLSHTSSGQRRPSASSPASLPQI